MKMMIQKRISILLLLALLLPAVSHAHHVLGRPAYALNEDSNTPSSMQVETQIGDYFVNYMIYPAFPKPHEAGRINLYASRIDNGDAFKGEVSFSVRDDRWFAGEEEKLGAQVLDDAVFRQGFIFSEEGDYIVTARFTSGGQAYVIDFPMRVGNPAGIGPLGIAVGLILLVLVGVNLIKRKGLMRTKARQHHAENT